MKGFMSQLMDHQKREEEREKLAEARYQELLTRTAEPSPAVAPDTSSLTEERERSDEMLRELISQLKEKTAEHDNMLREVMDGW